MLKVYKPIVLLASWWVDRLSSWWKSRWLTSEGPASHGQVLKLKLKFICSKFIWWAKVKHIWALAWCAQGGWSSFVSSVVPCLFWFGFEVQTQTCTFENLMSSPMITISVNWKINPEKVGPKLLLDSKTSKFLPWPTALASYVWLAGPHEESCGKCHFHWCIAMIHLGSGFDYIPIHISLMKLATLQLSSEKSTTHRHQAVPGLYEIYLENLYLYDSQNHHHRDRI